MSSSDLRARMDGLEVLGKADAVYPEPLSRHNRAPFAQQVNKLGYKRETATNVLKQAQKVPTILYRKWGCVSHFFVLLPHCMELANPDAPNHLQKKSNSTSHLDDPKKLQKSGKNAFFATD